MPRGRTGWAADRGFPSFGHIDLQPGAGVPPHAIRGRRRHPDGPGGLVPCQPREEAQFDQVGVIGFDLREVFQSPVEGEQVGIGQRRSDVAEGLPLAAVALRVYPETKSRLCNDLQTIRIWFDFARG